MADAEDPWTLPQELEGYLDFWGWEEYLSDKARHRLAVTRSQCAPEHDNAFAMALASAQASPEFHDALREAGDDKAARAAVRAQHEIDCYPFRIDWEDDELEV